MQAKKKQNPSEPVIRLVEVTPALAAEWLKGNQSNRPLSFRLVNRLMSEMLADQFVMTADTIKRNGERLLDGQHRLEAVVRSGCTVKMFVAENVDPDVFPFLDTGKARIAADVLASSGYQNVFSVASTARLIWHFERKDVSFHAMVTNNGVFLTVKRHPALTGFVREIQAHKFAKNSAIIAPLYWIWCCNQEKGDQFISDFLQGVELKITSPIYTLRERIINDVKLRAARSHRTGRRAVVAMFFRAWEAWLEGRTQVRAVAINPSSTDFPWPTGGPYL
jgi:hypothetical protein